MWKSGKVPLASSPLTTLPTMPYFYIPQKQSTSIKGGESLAFARDQQLNVLQRHTEREREKEREREREFTC